MTGFPYTIYHTLETDSLGNLYIAYKDPTSQKAVVKQFVNNQWQPLVGTTGEVSADSVAGTSLYRIPGGLMVTYSYSGGQVFARSLSFASLNAPSVAISATDTTNICPGLPVVFSASLTNISTTPVYQWYKNNVQVGLNSAVYTDSTLTTGDSVYAAVTAAGSNTVSSNLLHVTVDSVYQYIGPLNAIVNWSQPGNWCGGHAPDSTNNVVIPAGVTMTMDVAVGSCNNLTVSVGAILNFQGANTLNVYGNYLNQGITNTGGGNLVIVP